METTTYRLDRATRPEVFRTLGAVALALLLFAAGGEQEAAADMHESGAVVQLQEPENDGDVMRSLEMERGKSRFVRTSYPVKRVSVGDPEILEVAVINPREFQLVAKAVGATNVLVWDRSGRPMAAIDVSVGSAHAGMQRELRRILDNPDLQVESAGQGIVLKGSVPDALALEHAVTVARRYLGDTENDRVVNLLQVGGNQQVMLRVVIAEMARQVSREFGTNFNALIEAGNDSIQISNFIDGLSSFTEDGSGDIVLTDAVNLVGQIMGFGSLTFLQVFLDVLDERGLAKVLAEPTLVARSGESATFLVGGEVAIPVAQGGAFGSITIEYKPFGVGVQFTPTVLGEDRIHLQVAPEVSNVDFTLGATFGGTTIPGFNTRRAGTAVELADGQSFAVAGLLREELRERQGAYPLVGRLPIVGSAFRSSTFDKRETELVIIVTPYLVKPLGPGPHPLPTDQFIEPNAAEFYLLGVLEGHPSRKHTQFGGMIGDVGHRVQAVPEGGTK